MFSFDCERVRVRPPLVPRWTVTAEIALTRAGILFRPCSWPVSTPRPFGP